MDFHFYWIAVIFLLMLFIPNILWARTKDKALPADKENPILLVFEKFGQAGSTFFSLFSLHGPGSIIWLIASFLFLCIYEVWWYRYFHGSKTLEDFYSGILGIPYAGATCPVIAFFLLGIYEKNPFLLISVAVLAIGHIGIFYQHNKFLSKQ